VADDLNEDAADRKLRDRARDAREHATEARRQAEVRIRQEGERRSWVHVLLDTYDRDRRRAGGLLSGGVAFRLFVWALPFSLVLVTSLGFLADSTGRTVESLGQDSGLSLTILAAVAKAVETSTRNRPFLLALGLGLLFLASSSGLRALNVVSIVAWELEPRAPKRMVAGSIAFTLAGLYAVSDEFHQSFVPSRTSALGDVGFDFLGGVIGLLLMLRLRNEPRALPSHSVL